MCEKCGEAVNLLVAEYGITEKEACGELFEISPFPFGTGEIVLNSVKEFIARQKKETRGKG